MRVNAASEFVVGLTGAAAATTEATHRAVQGRHREAPMVHAAVWGEYPQTVGIVRRNVASVLTFPRTMRVWALLSGTSWPTTRNDYKRNAMNAAALAAIYEQIGEFEMGNAFGI